MANMSYCRFENTLGDLRDCYDAMDETCSDSETRARKSLIDVCCDIAVQYGWQIKRDCNEE